MGATRVILTHTVYLRTPAGPPLTIALQLIGTHIYVSDYHADGLLFVDEREEGYGFPVPANIRDLLVGVDKMTF